MSRSHHAKPKADPRPEPNETIDLHGRVYTTLGAAARRTGHTPRLLMRLVWNNQDHGWRPTDTPPGLPAEYIPYQPYEKGWLIATDDLDALERAHPRRNGKWVAR